jgi:hypothetical protein
MGMSLAPEFSRIFHLDKKLFEPVNIQIKADVPELIGLAKRFELREIKNLTVTFTITPRFEGGQYDLTGIGNADVVQTCVVSLKDVTSHLNFSLYTQLVEGVEEPVSETDILFLEDATDVDYYQNHQIDLGEIAAQYFFLELDPYPRLLELGKKDKEDKKTVNEDQNPFSILKNLKNTD